MSTVAKIDRRQFLALGFGTGFALTFRLGAAKPLADAAAPFAPNAFVAIDGDGTVHLTVHRSEMGQGIRTSIAMILADELDADWSRIQVHQAVGDARYGDQNTVGDFSVRLGWDPLRQAAASARMMLVAAAARMLSVPAAEVTTVNGEAVHAASGRRVTYAQLALLASHEEVPATPVLKKRDAYRIIGKSQASIDLEAMTHGGITYGTDVRREGMLFATVVRAPVVGARIKSFDATAARTIPGFVEAFALEGSFKPLGETLHGVAIVARDTWSCLSARAKVMVDWDAGDHALESNETLAAKLETAIAQPGTVYGSSGDVAKMREQASRLVKRRYATPFLVHAPLEPPNCTADVGADRCEVWAPTQDPQDARVQVATELGLPLQNVVVNVTFIGGGFGRKSLCDFILEAVRISRHMQKPVKLLWTREDDIRNGFFKPRALQELEAGVDLDGKVTFWRHHTAFATLATPIEGPAVHELGLGDINNGVMRFPYSIPHLSFEGTHIDLTLRSSWMRGITTFFHSFAANSFIDELSAETKRDPIELRLSWLEPDRLVQTMPASSPPTSFWMDTARLAAAIRRARDLSEWSAALPRGRGRGFAVDRLSGTVVATVAEVTLEEDGFRVDRVVSVADCGIVVNPDGARAQIEGGIMFALSCVLYGEITLANGRVEQDNYTNYPIARMRDTPEIVVDLMESNRVPTGLGEPCVPPVGPAIANAIVAAGGSRPYAMPFYSRARRGLA